MNSLTISGRLGSDAKQTQNEKGGTSFSFTVFVNEYDFKKKENVGIPVYCRHYAGTEKAANFMAERLTKGSPIIVAGKFSANIVRPDKDGNQSSLLCMDAQQLDFPVGTSNGNGQSSGNGYNSTKSANNENPFKKEAPKQESADSLDIDDLPF